MPRCACNIPGCENAVQTWGTTDDGRRVVVRVRSARGNELLIELTSGDATNLARALGELVTVADANRRTGAKVQRAARMAAEDRQRLPSRATRKVAP